MYIALDQSPLRLSAFKLNDMMTSTERLTHALTVHYLSAAILGAGELHSSHMSRINLSYIYFFIYIEQKNPSRSKTLHANYPL